MKKLLLLVISFGLMTGTGACSEVQAEKATISAEALLITCETAAAQYIKGDFGTPNPEIVAEIKTYDAIAYKDIVDLRTKAQAGSAVPAAETLAATTAITVFENFLVSKKILSTSDIGK